MFLRKLYLNFIKLLNHKSVARHLNLFSFENLGVPGSDVRNLDIFKKIYLCVLPNFRSTTYNLLNENTVRLIRFRKKFLPSFSKRFETYISYDYDFLSDSFIFEYFDFLKENISEDFSVLNTRFKSKNDLFSFYLMLFFLKKHFYKYFSHNFFIKLQDENFSKINFFFAKIFFNSFKKNKIRFSNIEKYTNWFRFVGALGNTNFPSEKFFSESLSDPLYESVQLKSRLKIFQKNIDDVLKDDIRPYVVLYSEACWALYNSVTYRLIKTVYRVKIDLNKLNTVVLNSEFLQKLKGILPYRYSDSSINKHINLSKLDNFIIFYLRKSKIFNKGRYSRNRQTYRTGFYWCLWLNIFVVYGLHFVFYRFTFTFGYLWLFLFIFFGSFVFSRALKYNLISLNSIITEVKEFWELVKYLLENIIAIFIKGVSAFINYTRKLFHTSEIDDSRFMQNDDYAVYLFNIVEDYLYEQFESDIEVLFRNDADEAEKMEILRKCLAEEMYLTDAHDIQSEMFEERMLGYQRNLIAKFRENS